MVNGRCSHGFALGMGLCVVCDPHRGRHPVGRQPTMICRRCRGRVAREKLDSNIRCAGGCRDVIKHELGEATRLRQADPDGPSQVRTCAPEEDGGAAAVG